MNIGDTMYIGTAAGANFGVIPTMATTGDPRHQSHGDSGKGRPLPVKSLSVAFTPIHREPDGFTPTYREPSPTYPPPHIQRALISAKRALQNAA